MWLLRMRHLCCSLVHDTQSTAKGHRNHWWLTIISFDLFRFPAPPYQAVTPSVIHQKDTIATIRACQGHFQHTVTKMCCLWGLFSQARCQPLCYNISMSFLVWFIYKWKTSKRQLQKGHKACGIQLFLAFQFIKNIEYFVGYYDNKLQ